jgi:hypothetical protein
VFSASELKAILARIAALMLLGHLPAWAQSFTDAPISCGTGSQYKGCTASFDGQKLLMTYNHARGQKSTAVYSKCATDQMGIHCAEGRWLSDTGVGQLGARSIGLRGGLPFPD